MPALMQADRAPLGRLLRHKRAPLTAARAGVERRRAQGAVGLGQGLDQRLGLGRIGNPGMRMRIPVSEAELFNANASLPPNVSRICEV